MPCPEKSYFTIKPSTWESLFTRDMSFLIPDPFHQKMFNFKMTKFLNDVITIFLSAWNQLSQPVALWAKALAPEPEDLRLIARPHGWRQRPPLLTSHGVCLLCRWHLQVGLTNACTEGVKWDHKTGILWQMQLSILKISIITVPLAQNADCGKTMLPE